MVQCFVPDCNYQSEALDCKFYKFPKDEKEKKRWKRLMRKADKTLHPPPECAVVTLEMVKKYIADVCQYDLRRKYEIFQFVLYSVPH